MCGNSYQAPLPSLSIPLSQKSCSVLGCTEQPEPKLDKGLEIYLALQIKLCSLSRSCLVSGLFMPSVSSPKA